MKQGHPLLAVAAIIIVSAFICTTILLLNKTAVPEFFGLTVTGAMGLISGLYIERPRPGTRTRHSDGGID